MTGLEIIRPGAQMLLQDEGRFGFQALGMTSGGAMDEHAARWANHLLDNPASAPVLEITLGNAELKALSDVQVAITGADAGASIDGLPVRNWSVHRLSAGQCLRFDWASRGARIYVAVQGGFQVAPEFGSVSTVVRESMGGLDGQSLSAGQILPCLSGSAVGVSVSENREVPFRFRPDYDAESIELRLVQGYQCESFTESQREQFFTQPYSLLPQSDRMGCRLNGPAIAPEKPSLHSEGIAYGAVQVPPDGQPIIMLKDRQTIGGYPKIGTVIPLDLFRLAQCRAGTAVRFSPVSVEQSRDLMRDFTQFFAR